MTTIFFNRQWHQDCVVLQNDSNLNRWSPSEIYSFMQSVALKDEAWCRGTEETWSLFLSLPEDFCTIQGSYILKLSLRTTNVIYGPLCWFYNCSRVCQDLKLIFYFKDTQECVFCMSDFPHGNVHIGDVTSPNAVID